MWGLFSSEIKKIWRNRKTITGLIVLLLANLYLIALSSKTGFTANAYRKMNRILIPLTMEQKEQYLDRQSEMLASIKVFASIEASEKEYGITEYSVSQKKESEELYSKYYYDYYRSHQYIVYTEDFYTEQAFLSYINKEYQNAARYELYLQSIIDKADALINSSVNNESESIFRIQSIEKMRDKYEQLKGIEMDYMPCKGIEIPLSTRITDWILLFISLYLSVSVIYDERKTGMYYLVQSTPLGRRHVAFCKAMAGLVSVLLTAFLFYGANLLVFQTAYGYVPLGISIQSCSCFMSSPLKLSIIKALGLFFLTKTIPVYTVFLISLLFSALFNSWSASFLGTAATLSGGLAIKPLFNASGKWSWIKYLGTLNLMDPQESIFNYFYMNIKDTPVSRLSYEIGISIVRIVLLSVIYILILSEKRVLRSKKVLVFKKNKSRTVKTCFDGESYKFLIEIKNAPVLIVFIAGMILFYSKPNYISISEQIYRQQMEIIEGLYTQETYDYLREWNSKFEVIRNVERDYNSGLIDSQEYQEEMRELSDLRIEYAIFNHIVKEDVPYALSTDGAKLLYNSGYKYLFDVNGNKDKLLMLFTFAITIIVFSNYYLVEEKGKLAHLLRVVPMGQNDLYTEKKRVMLLYSILLPVIEGSLRIIRTWMDYGLSGLLYEARSLNWLDKMPHLFSVIAVYFLSVILKCFCVYAVAICTVGLSVLTKNLHPTVLISFLIFCLFPTLSYLGETAFENVSLFSLYHCSCFLKKSSLQETVLQAVIIILLIIIGNRMIYKYSKGD